MEKIVDMTDALKQVRATEQEKLVVTKADKKINSPAYQSYKAGDKEHYKAADDLEEQKRQLEEEIKCLSEEMDSMIREKRQEGFAVRYSLDGKRKVQAYKTEKDAEHRAEILKSMGGVKDVSITKHTLNFKEEELNESFKVGDKVKFVDKGSAHFDRKGKVIRDHGDGSYSVEILFPSGRTLTPNNVKNKDIVKEEVLDEASPTIAKVKDIAKNKQAAKIDGTTVDLFTASAISQVYDKVNDVNKKKMDGMKIIPLANIAMKLLKNEYEPVELDDAVIKEKNND